MLDSISKYLGPFKKILFVFNKHRFITYLVFIIILYAILIYKINGLSQVTASSSNQVPTTTIATPQKINPQVLTQLQQLQNNNVSVQSLFQQARNNPF